MEGFFEMVGGWVESWIAEFGGWGRVDWQLLFGIGLGIGVAEVFPRRGFDRVWKSGDNLQAGRRPGEPRS